MAQNNSTAVTTKVITGLVRFSYAQVFHPKAVNEGDEPKYSISILIPKTDTVTLEKINKAIEAAKAQGMSKIGKNGKIPTNIKLPLRDGDTEREDDENYAGCFFLNASSFRQPGIIDKDRQAILDEDEFYSGCYGRASINFYAFNSNGNKGIAVGLNNLQKLKDGERLAGGASAEEDFADDFDDNGLLD